MNAHDEPVFPGGGNTVCHCQSCKLQRGEASADTPVEQWCLTPFCAYCYTRELPVKVCNRCRGVRYCGAQCQRAAWGQHKKKCSAPGDPEQEDARWARMWELRDAGDLQAVIKEEDLLERQLMKIADLREHLPVIDALAVAHSKAGSLEAAARMHQRAAFILGELHDYVRQGATFFKVASLILRIGDDAEALAFYEKTRALATRAGCLFLEAEASSALGNLCMQSGELQKSSRHLRRALECVKSLGSAEELEGASEVEARAHGELPLLLGTSRDRREISLLLELASAHAEAAEFDQADFFVTKGVAATEVQAGKGERLPEELFANQLRGMIALAREDNSTVALSAAAVVSLARDSPVLAEHPMGLAAIEWAESISRFEVVDGP